mmetsp:Transcript_20360/g.18029  ORF Transcript_20360/g.18029 Transcript_20360/m.18029 type:complete len:111 (+) Transcript_20360:398-730(+)
MKMINQTLIQIKFLQVKEFKTGRSDINEPNLLKKNAIISTTILQKIDGILVEKIAMLKKEMNKDHKEEDINPGHPGIKAVIVRVTKASSEEDNKIEEDYSDDGIMETFSH